MNNKALVRWNGILMRPRQTINWVLNKKISQFLLLSFTFLVGVFNELGKAKRIDYSDTSGLLDFLFTLLFYGGIMQVVTYTLLIWGVNLASSWFGGGGNFKKTQIAFTWNLLLLFISGFALTVFGYSLPDADVFFTEISNIYKYDYLLTYKWVYDVLYMVLVVWYTALIVISISEVQKLSILRSIGSLVCGIVIIIIPLAIITLIVNPRLWYGV